MNEAGSNQNYSFDATAIDLQAVRSRLVDKGLFFASLVMPLALVMSLVRNIEHGWHPIVLLHLFATGSILIGVIFRKRLSYQVRSSILLGVFLLVGIAGLVVFGLIGAGLLPLVLFALLTAILFGTREGLIACVLVVGIIALTGWGVISGTLTFSFDIEKYATSVTAWSSIAIVFFLCTALIVFVFGNMQEHLAASLRDSRETHARHERLVDNLTGTFLYRHDTEGVFEYVSSSITHVLGYSQEEFQAHFSKYLTDHSVNLDVVKHTEQSLKGIQQLPYELQIYHKDKRVRWLEVSETPVINSDGNVIAVEGVAHDITDRKRAEDELEQRRVFQEAVLECIAEGIVACDQNGTLAFFNRATREFHGLPAEPIPPQEWASHYDLYEEDGTTPLSHERIPLFRALNGEEVFEQVIVIAPKGLPPRTLLSTGRKLVDSDGNPLGAVVSMNDITERKRAEEEKTKLQSQLRHAQKMDAIGQLAAGVAHEFNNIIVGIRGNAESLLHTSSVPVPEQFKQPLKDIERSGERAFKLTQQLLSFARKKSPNQTVFDINHVVTNNERIFQRIIGTDITLKTQLVAEPALVKADEAEIEQAILNLVMNARDAMEHGGTLVILTQVVTLQNHNLPQGCRAGNFVQLSIADDGCGMSPETVERIFEPFFTTKSAGKGTGLGLSTVYSNITKIGGFISVESGQGTGTFFTLHLPQSTESIEEKKTEKNKSSGDFTGGKETILVCDDEEIVLSSIAHLLQSVGYKVICAGKPHQALEIVAEQGDEVSLLLTDITMPKMNGFELGKKIHQQYPDMKIIYSSGYSADRNKMDTAGGNVTFFDKGDSSVELLHQIRALLD